MAVLLLGWPTIILSVTFFGMAFARPGSKYGFAGLAAAVPFLWYASHAPRGEWYSPALFLALAAAAILLHRRRRGLALLCLAPFAVLILLLAGMVASQG